ncbi:unnamed protein product [Protopolystoma xenopodis]|uniref:Uncharacterized protein n=1 Tax=Protopolystoma xenopodis TaxID=117903 RepID=A0A3S5ALA2_9PLAT|nr:unnamed protein product [Protopolystoma xenopodis]
MPERGGYLPSISCCFCCEGSSTVLQFRCPWSIWSFLKRIKLLHPRNHADKRNWDAYFLHVKKAKRIKWFD